MALRKPPLREAHAERGAKFTEFGGWDMPVEFDSIRAEHEAVRTGAGIFDVSHMGEIEVSGPDAERLMNRLTTNDAGALDPGEAQYSAITDESGAMLDDTVVYRLPEDADADYLFVPNAGHDDWMHERWIDYRDDNDLEAVVENATDEYAMFALQGPEAVGLASDVADTDLNSLSRFSARHAEFAGVKTLVARTGYTGEDGVELLVPWDEAATVWEAFVPEATPCGLGARDTLRIEAGFLLSGQDFDHESNPRNPYEAGIDFVVKLDTEFVGRDALEQANEEGVDETFVGFRLTERGVPRHGYDIVNTENRVIGEVTSGTMSPTLDQPIGMGYLPTEYADPGTTVRVVVRGQQKKARVQPLPFYERQ
ncbi:glycine cleavage system aminomethyltransferase GcvT [Halorarius halobius]|uniref:glycine cleavage system aminomethyltransferase GcvT n=1 Tax=Halorarius halobius TaxID=2962671 RepID=UPI0020CD25C8|nr:glycine cleavage system aminomethyltransferase GcvT [Halorarius halobius]